MQTTPLLTSQESFPCSDGFSMPAYITRPNTAAPLPALVFIYEIFGLTKEMERVAGDFASAGYVVMMPDLFSRGSWFSCVRKLLGELKAGSGRGVQDLLQAQSWLAQKEFVNAGHMATIGFCMGGGFALILSKTGMFRVAAPFYGQVPDKLDGACPIIGSYGERDKVLRPQAEKMKNELARLGIANDVKVYPGAGHGFMNDAPNAVLRTIASLLPIHAGFNPEAAADAKARVLNFLQTHL